MNNFRPDVPSIDRSVILAVILSGGAGRRFDGRDKGLQQYAGKSMIQVVIDSIAPQVGGVLLCVNRNVNAYEKFGYPVVTDQSDSFEGPMAGLVSAINHVETVKNLSGIDTILLSSCDSPSLPNNYVAKLALAMQAENASAARVNDGKRNQNLHCLIHRDKWSAVTQFFDDGGRAMHRLHKMIGTIEVDFSDQAQSFSNINSPDQLLDH